MAFSFKGTKVPEEELSGYMRARRRAFSGPLMFVVVVVAAIFVMSVFFRVEDIRVVGNQHYTAEEIIRAVDIEEGDNLFFFDRFAAVGRAFSKLPYIEAVTVERSLPNKVVITVEETTARRGGGEPASRGGHEGRHSYDRRDHGDRKRRDRVGCLSG